MAWREPSHGTNHFTLHLTSDGELYSTYDGKNRRIVEKGYTADGMRTHLDHYCLGASIIETRDRFVDGGTLKPRVVSMTRTTAT